MYNRPTAAQASRLLLGSLIFLGLLLSPGATRAHEFWLAPSRYDAAIGAPIEVQACVGTGFRGDPLPYSPARTVRFELHGDRDLDLAESAVNGDPSYAHVSLADSSGAVLVYESNFTEIQLPPDAFDRYLALEGLDEVLAARRASEAEPPGRERFRRCGKAWLTGRDGSRATKAYGLPFEIVPLSDPSRARDEELGVRLLYDGRPVAGALVRAWRQPFGSDRSLTDPAMRDSVGPSADARSDREGVARLRIHGSGEWLLSAVRMVPVRRSRFSFSSAETPDADWESSWASLTFLRKEEGR